MGGELMVESTQGMGSGFWFSSRPCRFARICRVRTATRPPGIDARLPPGERLTALVADDNTINRRVLASLLSSAGIRVITASGGREAVNLAVRLRPDVVLIDLRMNDLHGFEVTRLIHASSATAARRSSP